MSDTIKHANYYAGFDYLRAILALAVIAIHTRLVSSSGRFAFDEKSGINIFDIIHFNLFFLAVPVFFIISLFLFYKKNGTFLKDGRKIYQLLILYVFWTGAWILFKDTRPGDGISDIFIFIIRGGQSIFWFLFSLTFVTALAALTRKLSVKLTWAALCISILMVMLFPILNMHDSAYRYLVAFWNPLLFVPYVFVAKLLVYYEDFFKKNKPIKLILLIVFIALCALEWLTLVHPNHELVQAVPFPLYSRISLAVGAVLLVIASFQIQSSPPKVIKVLSSVSLGLYCIHPFLIALTPALKRQAIGIHAVMYFLLITVGSLALTYCLKQILRERLM